MSAVMAPHRKERARTLRETGMPWREIAERLGYASAESAMKSARHLPRPRTPRPIDPQPRDPAAQRRALAAAAAWSAHASKRGPTWAARRDGKPTGRTRDRLAALYGVSSAAVQQARALIERDAETVEAVWRGELRLAAAYEALRHREGAGG